MKTYKSIAYSYASSPTAESLGFYDAGCFSIEIRHHDIEGSGQDETFTPHNAEGFKKANHPDLIAMFKEADGIICPMFLRFGNQAALNAIKGSN